MPRSRSPVRGRRSPARARSSRSASRSRGRKRSRSYSSYSSSSRSPSSSYSRSGSSSYSRSSYSRSPSRGHRRRRTPPRRSRSYDRGPRRMSPPRTRKRSRTPSPKRVLVKNITRNVNQDHLKEIFSTFGDVTQVVVPMNPKIKTNIGKAEIFFKVSDSAEKARRHMDGAQIDGNIVQVTFMIQDRPRTYDSRRLPPHQQYSQRKFGAQGRIGGGRRSRTPPRRSDIRNRGSPPRRSPFRRRPAPGRH